MSNRVALTRFWWIALAILGLLVLASAARASTAQEEQQGAQILGEFESGKLECSDASADDFELVGDYAMGRMLGSTSGHEAMDGVMTRMMGAQGERRAHVTMGRRYAGCGGGQLPAGFGQMMGAINGMGMMGGIGQGGRDYANPDSMMGGYRHETGAGDDFNGPSAAAMIGMMALLIAAAAVAVLWLSRRRAKGPLDVLEQRFAAGDLTAEQYQVRKRLLERS